MRDWIYNNIFPYEYDSRSEFERDINQRIPTYDIGFSKQERDNVWSDYQDLVSRVEDAEQELEDVAQGVAQEPVSKEAKKSLMKRISTRLKKAIDKLRGFFK